MAEDEAVPVTRGLFYELLHDLAGLLPGSAEHKAEVAASIDQHQAEHDKVTVPDEHVTAETPVHITAESTEGNPA
jgi:hypothetical protein